MTTKREKTPEDFGLEEANGWPEGYAKSFAGVPRDVRRHSQDKPEKRKRSTFAGVRR